MNIKEDIDEIINQLFLRSNKKMDELDNFLISYVKKISKMEMNCLIANLELWSELLSKTTIHTDEEFREKELIRTCLMKEKFEFLENNHHIRREGEEEEENGT